VSVLPGVGLCMDASHGSRPALFRSTGTSLIEIDDPTAVELAVALQLSDRQVMEASHALADIRALVNDAGLDASMTARFIERIDEGLRT
jgi:hypothetical protein